jgi:hypothetical protein
MLDGWEKTSKKLNLLELYLSIRPRIRNAAFQSRRAISFIR